MHYRFKYWLEQQTYTNEIIKRSHTWDDVKRLSWTVSEKNMMRRTVDKNKIINIGWKVEYES